MLKIHKMKNIEQPRTIEGEWDWREISANLPEGWTALESKSKGSHIWKFNGDGTMTSNEGTHIRHAVKYRYDPEKLRLILNGHLLDDTGEPEMPIKERYRVEFPSPNEMLLYDLGDVAVGLEEESLRLRFTRT